MADKESITFRCAFSEVRNSCGCIVGYNIPMNDPRGEGVPQYPVSVRNQDDVFIDGTPTVGHFNANNPSEFVAIWNSDASNQAVGTLYVGVSKFCFYLKLAPGGVAPSAVIGEWD